MIHVLPVKEFQYVFPLSLILSLSLMVFKLMVFLSFINIIKL